MIDSDPRDIVARSPWFDGLPDEALQVLAGDYEGGQLLGPNGVAVDSNGTIFFTDSGPIGSTGLHRAKGSVFMVSPPTDPSGSTLRALILEKLAHPSGICVSEDGGIVYVTETLSNRVLRLARTPSGKIKREATCCTFFLG